MFAAKGHPSTSFPRGNTIPNSIVPGNDKGEGAEHAERVDADDERALAAWAEKFDTTPQQVSEAIAAVGNLGADVEMHLKGSHSTSNAQRVDDAIGA